MNNIVFRPNSLTTKRIRPLLSPKFFKIFGIFSLSIGVLFSVSIWMGDVDEKIEIVQSVKGVEDEKKEEVRDVEVFPAVGDDTVVEHEIAEGDIPAEVFGEYGGFDANDVSRLMSAAEDVYDYTQLRIGRELRFKFAEEARASRMEYDRNTETMIIAQREGDEFQVWEEDIAYEVTREVAQAKIENFLYMDALNAGVTEATVLELGDVFSFSIDFTTEIREGDEFILMYEKRMRDGERGPDGRILAAKFINNGEEFFAYHYDNDGEGGYYDGEGHALERQFLKAPLSYRRITSGFTGARLHPITKKVSAHYQIDYAAPVGTPVVATARGTVTQSSYSGGWGNIVRLKHDNGFTTHYAHLSAYAKGVKPGIRVQQGQVVGYVGSTGWSTGPHLDYGMKENGTPVNPLTLVQPQGKPLDEDDMQVFQELKNSYEETLGQI